MDDIERVDCFERLHRYLLQQEPDLQRRIDAQQALNYPAQDLSFFLAHLVALLSGIDDETAEGKRRIRRFLLDFGETPPDESIQKSHLLIREQGGVLEKPIPPEQEKAIREGFNNLKNISADSARTGAEFEAQMQRLSHLPARVEYLRKLLPSLSSLNVFHYLARIGYPILIPDNPCQTFFFRLGLLGKTGSSLDVQLKACEIGQSIASSLKRSLCEVNLWIRAFVGSIPNLAATTALCRRSPHCDRCKLHSYCHHYRFLRPRAQNVDEPLSIKEWRPTERPRERLMQRGAGSLDEAELLAIILRTGAGKMNVLELARKLLERFKSLQGIEDASLEELQSLHGIGKMKAIELKAVFELGRRLIYRPVKPGDVFCSSEEVFRGYSARFSYVKQEEFILLMLDAKNRVIREEVISRGGLTSSVVHPREVFKAAIRASASAVLFIHNHPSGDPTPSHDDRVVTQKLEEAAQFLQIRVLDHLIIGRNAYFSFTDDEICRVESV